MAGRQDLREFQTRLSERLRKAASGPAQSARLGVQIGGRRLLVDLAEAAEIVALGGAIAPVPLTQDWFKGLVNLRGSLFGVSDLARFEGGEFTPLTKQTRLLALAPRLGLNAAILVERMLGLQNPSAMNGDEGDSGDGGDGEGEARRETPWRGQRWTDADGNRWTELRLAALAGDERFLAVGR